MQLRAHALSVESFTAGDTVRFSVSLTDYPASEYTMDFTIRNGANILTVPGSADGDNFDVVFTAVQTAGLLPGLYTAGAVFTETATGDETAVYFRGFQVRPSLTNTTVGPRRTAYNAALAKRDGLLAKSYASTTVDGQTFTMHNLDSFQRMLDRMAMEAADEDRLYGVGTGGGRISIITRM